MTTETLDKRTLAIQINRLAAICRPTNRTDADWQVVIEQYFETLSRYRPGFVHAAFNHAAEHSEFFPTLPELREFCDAREAHAKRMERPVALPSQAEPEMTAEERERCNAMWERVRAEIRATVDPGRKVLIGELTPAEAEARLEAIGKPRLDDEALAARKARVAELMARAPLPSGRQGREP